MKRFAVILVGILSTTPVFADTNAGSQTITLLGGVAGDLSDATLDNAHFRHDRMADGGGMLAGQSIYFIRNSPTIGVGFDIAGTRLSDHDSDDILLGYQTTSHYHTQT